MAGAVRMWSHIEGMGPIKKCLTDSGRQVSDYQNYKYGKGEN